MNKRNLKNVTIAAGLVCVGATLLAMFQSAPSRKNTFQTLSGVSAIEMPQAAAQIVSQAPKADQPAVAREVMEKVAALSKPGVTPFAVAAICRAAPDVAVEVTSTALARLPEERVSIANAAFRAAPGKAEAILAALPALKDIALSQPPAPPRVGPPFTPASGGSTEYNAGSGNVLPPGTARNYSAP